MRKLTALLAAFMWIGVAQAAPTMINNGSFETNDLTGWGFDPRVVTREFQNNELPTDGQYMARLTPAAPGGDDDQECLLADFNFTDCAYLYQFLTINQYDTILFDWNFKDQDDENPDEALYFIGTFDSNSGLQTLATGGQDAGWTGWNTASFYNAGPTQYGVIAFAIANYGDSSGNAADSRLLIDNVRVPEPGSLALLGMGLLGLGFSRKRAG